MPQAVDLGQFIWPDAAQGRQPNASGAKLSELSRLLGVTGFALPGQALDAVSNAPMGVNGTNIGFSVGNQGPAIACNSNTNVSYLTLQTPPSAVSSRIYSIAALIKLYNNTTDAAILTTAGSSTSNQPLWMRMTGTTLRITQPAVADAANHNIAAPIGSYFVAIMSVNEQTGSLLSINGVTPSSSAFNLTIGHGQSWAVGGRLGYADSNINGEIAVVLIAPGRFWGTSDHSLIGGSDGFWNKFFVSMPFSFSVAANGSLPTLSAATYTPGSITSAGFSSRVTAT